MKIRFCFTLLAVTSAFGVAQAENKSGTSYKVPYTINMQEFPSASYLLTIIGKFPVQKQGKIDLLVYGDGMYTVYLMNQKNESIGMDVLFHGKDSLSFTQLNTAKAAFSNTGLLGLLSSVQKINIYHNLDHLEAFQIYVQAQKKAGSYEKVSPEILGKAQQPIWQKLMDEMRKSASKPLDVISLNRTLERYVQDVYKIATAYQSDNPNHSLPSLDCSRGYSAGQFSVIAPAFPCKCEVQAAPGGHLKIIASSTQTGKLFEVE